MKIISERKKAIVIKEYDVSASSDLETGEVIDLNELVKKHFDDGNFIKVTIQRVEKSEEE